MPEHPGVELALLEVTVTAQRALLRARRPDDIVAALERAVHALGGRVVPGHAGGDEVLHLDLALGVRDPLLPWAPPDDPARGAIQRVLPALIEDARRSLHLLWANEDLGDPGLRDELTGALHEDATARLVGRARPDDALVGFALSDTDAVAEVHGRARVELLLRQLARTVGGELDVDERLGRLTGPTLVVFLPNPAAGRAADLVTRTTQRWERQRELPLGLRTSTLDRGDDAGTTLQALAAQLDEDRGDRP